MKKSVFLASIPFCFLFLAGCGSIQDLRARAPDRSASFEGTHDRLAKCVANEIDVISDETPALRINDFDQSSRVYFIIQPSMTPKYDLVFNQDGLRSVRVEGRGMTTIYGTDHWLKDLWPLISKCEKKIRNQNAPKG